MAADPDKPWRFQPGGPGGPGRPKGSRSKLGEAFLTALAADFDKGGVEAIEHVRLNDPSAYCKIISSILPKEVTGADGEGLFKGIEVKFVK